MPVISYIRNARFVSSPEKIYFCFCSGTLSRYVETALDLWIVHSAAFMSIQDFGGTGSVSIFYRKCVPDPKAVMN